MLFVYFGIMSVLSIYETVATPLNMDEFDWDAQTVRFICSAAENFLMNLL